jgi:hypothetical protein
MNISTRCPPPGPLRMAFDFSCFRSTMDTGWKLTFVVRRKVGKISCIVGWRAREARARIEVRSAI